MKILNNDIKRQQFNAKKRDFTSFCGKEVLSKITTPDLLKKISVAATSLGLASISLSKLNQKEKLEISNDEIIALINSCKEDEENYNSEKLVQVLDAIAKTNSTDKESEAIIHLMRLLGNPEDWVTKYPHFAKYFADTIVANTYQDESVYKELSDEFSKKAITPESIEMYEKYLQDGYDLDKKDFVELYNKSAFLGYLPINSDNFNNYSFETRNELINQVKLLLNSNPTNDNIDDFQGLIKHLPEKLIRKTFNNIEIVKNMSNGVGYKLLYEIQSIFETILQDENITEEEFESIEKHIVLLAFMGLTDLENYNNIINCSLYKDIVKDRNNIPLLENFDFETPYSTKDFKIKVFEFEVQEKNKLKNSELFKDYPVLKRMFSSLQFKDEEISEIAGYIKNAKNIDLMKDLLFFSDTLENKKQKEVSRKNLMYLIKCASSNPELVDMIWRKANCIPTTISAIKLLENQNIEFVEAVMGANSIFPEYWETIFSNVSENNINYVKDYIKKVKTIDENQMNKLFVLKDFANPNNKDLQTLLDEIDTIQNDTKQKLTIENITKYTSLLKLKELSPDTYEKIINSGFFEFFNNANSLGFLNENADLNSDLYADLEKVKNGESIIKEFDKNTNLQKAFYQSECSDVVSIGDELYINDGNDLVQWKMTKEKYLELFPPVVRFATQQGAIGDCYLVSSLSSMMHNAKSRVRLYQLFKQDGNDLYVTIKGYEDYQGTLKFPNGKKPWNEDSSKHLKGCDGLQFLEYAYAKTVFRENSSKRDVSVKEGMNDDVLMERIISGYNNVAIGELLGLEYDCSYKAGKIDNKSATFYIKDEKISEKQFEDFIEKYCNENYILNFSIEMFSKQNAYNVIGRHAHSIVGYDKANKIVLIENPHDCSITTKIPLAELYKLIDDLCITNIK